MSWFGARKAPRQGAMLLLANMSNFITPSSTEGTTFATSTITASENLNASPTLFPGSDGYSYLGCFKEVGSGSPGLRIGSTSFTPAAISADTTTAPACISACAAAIDLDGKQYEFVGIAEGSDCFCGSLLSPSTLGTDDSSCCLDACLGDASTACGGHGFLAVYSMTNPSKEGIILPSSGGLITSFLTVDALSTSLSTSPAMSSIVDSGTSTSTSTTMGSSTNTDASTSPSTTSDSTVTASSSSTPGISNSALSPSSKSSIAIAAGVVAGLLVITVLVVCGIKLYNRRRVRKQNPNDNRSSAGDHDKNDTFFAAPGLAQSLDTEVATAVASSLMKVHRRRISTAPSGTPSPPLIATAIAVEDSGAVSSAVSPLQRLSRWDLFAVKHDHDPTARNRDNRQRSPGGPLSSHAWSPRENEDRVEQQPQRQGGAIVLTVAESNWKSPFSVMLSSWGLGGREPTIPLFGPANTESSSPEFRGITTEIDTSRLSLAPEFSAAAISSGPFSWPDRMPESATTLTPSATTTGTNIPFHSSGVSVQTRSPVGSEAAVSAGPLSALSQESGVLGQTLSTYLARFPFPPPRPPPTSALPLIPPTPMKTRRRRTRGSAMVALKDVPAALAVGSQLEQPQTAAQPDGLGNRAWHRRRLSVPFAPEPVSKDVEVTEKMEELVEDVRVAVDEGQVGLVEERRA